MPNLLGWYAPKFIYDSWSIHQIIQNKWNFGFPQASPSSKIKWSCISVNNLTYTLLLLFLISTCRPTQFLFSSDDISSCLFLKIPWRVLYMRSQNNQLVIWTKRDLQCSSSYSPIPTQRVPFLWKPWTYLMDVIGLIKTLSSAAYVKVTKQCWLHCRNKETKYLPIPWHSLPFDPESSTFVPRW